MKVPSIINKFCKTCKSHQKMNLDKDKKGRARPNTWINRQKERYTGTTNKGKYSKPPKKVIKSSKRGYFKLKCMLCKKIRVYVTKRTKKVEILKIKND